MVCTLKEVKVGWTAWKGYESMMRKVWKDDVRVRLYGGYSY